MLKRVLFKSLRRAVRPIGLRLIDADAIPPDVDEPDRETIAAVQPLTQTTPERVYALIQAVRHIEQTKIPGGIVECGVWKGGSMAAVARTLLKLGSTQRELFLCDTFEGMPPPTEMDVDLDGRKAIGYFKQGLNSACRSTWNYASLDEVKAALGSLGYPGAKLHFVQGKVEDTIPSQAPDQIALLRLDTDFYESTLHELIHLYPRLSPGGVLIIDDYGHWQGARRAVDEYVAQQKIALFMNRIDYSGRMALKI